MAFWLIQWEYHFVGYRQKKAGKEITWCVEMALPDQKRSEQYGDESLVALGALKFRYYVDSIFAIFTWKLNQAHTDRQTHTWGRSVGSFGVILVLPQACFLVGWPWPPPTFELPAPSSQLPSPGSQLPTPPPYFAWPFPDPSALVSDICKIFPVEKAAAATNWAILWQ